MRYYVCSDVHGFYTLFIDALKKAGYFDDTEPHKLLLLGDVMDRGKEAIEIQNFILEQMEHDTVILIRGNHEDLFVDMIELRKGRTNFVDIWNGTSDTLDQLTGNTPKVPELTEIPLYKTIIPAMRNFYETSHYIFVHGYLPGLDCSDGYMIAEDWRNASARAWSQARWVNGIDASLTACPEKTVVCGHWHSSYGHALFENKGSEFQEDADFSPYFGKNLIAIDACTAHSRIVNCLVLED